MSSEPTRFRFGEFDLDLETRELRRQGAGRVILQDKPFDLLVVLVRQAPALVTREQLREALWGADTFVDVEHGLNTAVRKLREALGDDAQAPRFIETVARHGYRFVAPVEIAAREPASAASTSSVVDVGAGAGPPAARSSRRGRWLAAAAVALLVVAALGARRALHDPAAESVAARPIRSLAVLPLVNLSGDPREDYFAAGMTDMLITQLAKIADLQVVSRTTVVRYEGTKKTAPEIARELKVHALVEGSVVRDGSRVRINAQLIDGETDRHLWAEAYESELPGIVALQGRVARDVAAELSVRVSSDEARRLSGGPPVSPPALEAYIRGRAAFELWTREGTEQARDYFRRAIDLDPGYADAHAAMAETYVFGPDYFRPGPDAAALARRFGEKALRLDPANGSAHAALAQVSFVSDWDWVAAEVGFHRATELSPNNFHIRHLYSHYLISCGRLADSLEHVRRMLQLEPLSAAAQNHLAYQHLRAGEHEQALAAAAAALRIQPNYGAAVYHRALAQIGLRDHAAAVASLNEFYRLDGMAAEEIARGQEAFTRGGWEGYIEHDIAAWKRDLDAGRVSTDSGFWVIAQDYAILGRKDEAFVWLEKALATHSTRMTELREHPLLEPLRDDPRYADLERRLGIPPASNPPRVATQ